MPFRYNEGMDRRLRKTEEAIQNALIELVSKNGYENIRMVDVIEKADINKSTFYLHHQSLLGVSFAIEDKIVTSVLDILSGAALTDEGIIMQILESIRTNRKAWQTVLSVSEGHFYKKMEVSLDHYLSDLVENKLDKETSKYTKASLFGSLFGAIRSYALGSNRSDIKKCEQVISNILNISN